MIKISVSGVLNVLRAILTSVGVTRTFFDFKIDFLSTKQEI